jgi:translation elongation factor EF-G
MESIGTEVSAASTILDTVVELTTEKTVEEVKADIVEEIKERVVEEIAEIKECVMENPACIVEEVKERVEEVKEKIVEELAKNPEKLVEEVLKTQSCQCLPALRTLLRSALPFLSKSSVKESVQTLSTARCDSHSELMTLRSVLQTSAEDTKTPAQ